MSIPCDETSYLLKTSGLTKRFGSLVANRDIDMTVYPGRIHAILGENGAGKSTLMKMLYGVYEPDGGQVFMDGEEVSLHPPTKARARGIGMVFQDFRVVPALTALDNIALAVEKGWRFSRKRLRERILETSAKYGLEVNPDAQVWQLDLGQRQRLEIVKVLLSPGTRIVIFDEPTSVLVPQEVEAFLNMLDLLRKDGYGILLITHKINEVLAVADQVSVLRSGQMTYAAKREDGLTAETLISAMMGEKTLKPVVKPQFSAESAEEEEALRAKNVTICGDHGEPVLTEIELTLPKGKIVGVAGISGSGQRELAEALFGLRNAVHRRQGVERRDEGVHGRGSQLRLRGSDQRVGHSRLQHPRAYGARRHADEAERSGHRLENAEGRFGRQRGREGARARRERPQGGYVIGRQRATNGTVPGAHPSPRDSRH